MKMKEIESPSWEDEVLLCVMCQRRCEAVGKGWVFGVAVVPGRPTCSFHSHEANRELKWAGIPDIWHPFTM